MFVGVKMSFVRKIIVFVIMMLQMMMMCFWLSEKNFHGIPHPEIHGIFSEMQVSYCCACGTCSDESTVIFPLSFLDHQKCNPDYRLKMLRSRYSHLDPSPGLVKYQGNYYRASFHSNFTVR